MEPSKIALSSGQSKEDNWEVSTNREEGIKIRLRNNSKGAPVYKKSPVRSLPKKRKSSSDSIFGTAKKNRKMNDEVLQQFNNILKQSKTETVEELGSIIDKKLAPISVTLKSLEESNRSLSDFCETNARKIEDLSGTVEGIRDAIKEEIRGEFRMELDAVRKAAHKAELLKEIDRLSSHLIVHGLPNPTESGVKELIEMLAIENATIEIKKVIPLGKGGQPKTILVQLGDSNQRNAILGKASFDKMPKGVNIDRDVPPSYREKYREFKDRARDMRNFMGVICRVAFVGAELVLRYKEKGDDKQFVIADTFTPSPTKDGKQGNPNKTVGGRNPSKTLSPQKIEQARSSIILADWVGEEYNVTEEKLKKYLGTLFSEIVGISLSNKRPLIRCLSSKSKEAIINALEKENVGRIHTFK